MSSLSDAAPIPDVPARAAGVRAGAPRDRGSRSTLLVYRRELLPYSETFIREQAEGLRQFRPYYLGLRDVQNLPLPPERRCLLGEGQPLQSLRVASFRLTRRDPLWERSLRELRPVLLHAHFEWGGKDVVPLCRALRIPLVMTGHGKDVTEQEAPGARGWRAAQMRRLHARRRQELQNEGCCFLAVSRFIHRKMLERGYPAGRTHLHYIGVDTEKFSPSTGAEAGPPTPPVVVFVGRLIEKKGCEYLIRAMNELPETLRTAELIVIGDGPLRGALETLAGQLLRCPYRFLGRQTPEEVRGWLARARVFSLPSVTAETGETEGLPIGILEAMSMGVPVVSFHHAGIGEAVLDRVTGYLYPERDWRGLAGGLAELLRDDSSWQTMRAAARNHIMQHFQLSRQTQELESIYTHLLADRL